NNEQGRRFMIVYLYEYSLSSHGQDLLLKRNVVCQIFWELRSPVQSIAYKCISRCSTNSSLPFALIAHRVRLYSVVYHTQPAYRHQLVGRIRFRYRADSGLHTLSGRLLGWEVRVNHRQEQRSSDSVERVRSSETETQRNNTASGLRRFAFVAAVALIIGIFLVIRKMR